jgi:hypothetical protein
MECHCIRNLMELIYNHFFQQSKRSLLIYKLAMLYRCNYSDMKLQRINIWVRWDSIYSLIHQKNNFIYFLIHMLLFNINPAFLAIWINKNTESFCLCNTQYLWCTYLIAIKYLIKIWSGTLWIIIVASICCSCTELWVINTHVKCT